MVAVVVVVLMLYFVASLFVIADLILKCYCYRLRRCCFGWYHIAFVCVCVCVRWYFYFVVVIVVVFAVVFVFVIVVVAVICRYV